MQPARQHHHPRFNPLRFLPPLRNLLSSRRITPTVISDSPPSFSFSSSFSSSSSLFAFAIAQTSSFRLYLRLVAFRQRPPGRKSRAWFNTWMLYIRASISCFPGASTLLDSAPERDEYRTFESIFRRALRA